MSKSDYDKIKGIIGVSLVKNLKGNWFTRDEDKKLEKKISPILLKNRKFADGGDLSVLKKYNVSGTFYLFYSKLSEPKKSFIRDYEEKYFEKIVMAISKDEAQDVAINEIMEEYQGYVRTADIYVEDIVEIMARGGTSKTKEELLKEWIETQRGDKTITTQVGQPIYKMSDAWNNSSVQERKEMVKKLGRTFDVDYNLKYNEIPVGLQVFLEKKYLKTYMDLSGEKKENKTFADGGIAVGDRVIWGNENAYVEEIDGNNVKLFINHPESHNKGKVYSRDKHFFVNMDELKGKKIKHKHSKPFNYDEFMRYYGNEFKKGGQTKWIQEATKNNKGALRRTAKRKGLIKGDEKLSMTDIKKLEKMGGKTSKRAHLAETLKKLK
jgi:hypothetical protein